MDVITLAWLVLALMVACCIYGAAVIIKDHLPPKKLFDTVKSYTQNNLDEDTPFNQAAERVIKKAETLKKNRAKKVPKKKAEGFINIEGAPCKSGHHTSFMIVPDGGAFAPFPRENFLLTTESYQADVKRQIEAMGYDFKV